MVVGYPLGLEPLSGVQSALSFPPCSFEGLGRVSRLRTGSARVGAARAAMTSPAASVVSPRGMTVLPARRIAIKRASLGMAMLLSGTPITSAPSGIVTSRLIRPGTDSRRRWEADCNVVCSFRSCE